MALTIAELRYMLTGDTRSLDKSFATAETGMRKTELSGSRMAKGLTAAFAGMGIASAAGLYESVKAATDFQSQMTKIQTQAGASAADVKTLTKQVLGMRNAQQSPQHLAEALYHLKSVGLDNVQAMKALRQSSNLAAVGGSDLESTTNALAGAWRSGIKGAHSFHDAVATVNAIVGAGNMTMDQLTAAIATGILPAAKTFGVSFRSVGAALALMTDEGIPANLAATRLRMSLSLLGAPSKVAEDRLSDIGLTGTKLANAMRGPQGIIGAIQLLHDHIQDSGLTATQAAQLISHAFGGGQSSSAIMTMLNNLDVLKKKQVQINGSLGKFDSAVVTQRKTAEAQFKILQNRLDTFAVRVGSVVLPALASVVGWVDDKGLPALGKFSKFLGQYLIPVGQIKRNWDSMMRFLGLEQAPRPKVRKLTTADLYTVTPGQSVLSGYVPPKLPESPKTASLSALGMGGGAAQAAAKNLTQALGQVNWGALIGKVIGAAVNSAGAIGQGVVALIGKVDWTRAGSQAVTAAVPFVVGFVDNLGNALINEVVHHPLDVLVFVASLIPAGRLAGSLGKLLDGVPLLGKLTGWVLEPIEAAGSFVERTFGRTLLNAFKRAVDFIAPGLRAKITGLLDTLYVLIGSHVIDFLRAGKNLIEGLWSGAESLRDWLYGKISGLASGLVRLFGRSGAWLLSAGRSLIGGLFRGIKLAMSGIGGWIKGNVVDPVISAVKHFFGIHSPSTVMAGLGSHLMTGLFKGIMSHDLGGFIGKVFGSMPAALAALVGKGIANVASLPGRAVRALGGLGGKAMNLLGGLFGNPSGFGTTAALGKTMAAAMGWTGANWSALFKLWQRESGWRANARNPKSGAYGIPQALPASKMASAGPDWLTNAATQIKWGLGYIMGRYGSPLAAWAHETAFGWYAKGTMRVPRTGPAILHQDEAVMPATVADAMRKFFGGDGGRGDAPLIGTMNVNHVPGYSTPKDVERAVSKAHRRHQLART